MHYRIINSENWSDEKLRLAIRLIFNHCEMWFIKLVLNRYKVKNKTKIYYAFQVPYLYYERYLKSKEPNDNKYWIMSLAQHNEQIAWVDYLCKDRMLAYNIIDFFIANKKICYVADLLNDIDCEFPVQIEIVKDDIDTKTENLPFGDA